MPVRPAVYVGLVLAVAGGALDLWAAVVPITVGADRAPVETTFSLAEGPWPATVQAVVPAALVMATGLFWWRPATAAAWLVGSASALLLLDGALLTASIAEDHLGWATSRWLGVRVVALAVVVVGAVLVSGEVEPRRAVGEAWTSVVILGVLAYVFLALTPALGLALAPVLATWPLVLALPGMLILLVELEPEERWASSGLLAYGLSGTVFWAAQLLVRAEPGLGDGLRIAYHGSGGHTLAIVAALVAFAAVALAALRSFTIVPGPPTDPHLRRLYR